MRALQASYLPCLSCPFGDARVPFLFSGCRIVTIHEASLSGGTMEKWNSATQFRLSNVLGAECDVL